MRSLFAVTRFGQEPGTGSIASRPATPSQWMPCRRRLLLPYWRTLAAWSLSASGALRVGWREVAQFALDRRKERALDCRDSAGGCGSRRHGRLLQARRQRARDLQRGRSAGRRFARDSNRARRDVWLAVSASGRLSRRQARSAVEHGQRAANQDIHALAAEPDGIVWAGAALGAVRASAHSGRCVTAGAGCRPTMCARSQLRAITRLWGRDDGRAERDSPAADDARREGRTTISRRVWSAMCVLRIWSNNAI